MTDAPPDIENLSIDAEYVNSIPFEGIVANVTPPILNDALTVRSRDCTFPFWITKPGLPLCPNVTLKYVGLLFASRSTPPNVTDPYPEKVNVSGAPIVADEYVTRAVALSCTPEIVQLFAVAFAFRLLNVPPEITRPVVAGIATVVAVAATAALPKVMLSDFCEAPVPKTSLAFPVTVSFSGVGFVPVVAAA